jgi:integrase
MAVCKREGSKFYWYNFLYNNKRYQGSTKKTSLRKAEDFESDRRAQVHRIALGLEAPDPPKPRAEAPKFADYAREWLNVYVKVNCKEGTHRLNKQIVEDHLIPAFGNKKLDEITRPMVEAFIAKKIAQKTKRRVRKSDPTDTTPATSGGKDVSTLSKATVRNYMAVLRGILSKAVKDELIETNRAAGMGRFSKETSGKANRKHVIPLTSAEIQTLLTRAEEKGLVLYAFFLTAILTGMRISELIGLQWGDVDTVNHCLHVKRAVTHRRIETPKSHHQRQIELPEQLEPVLERLRTYRKEQWLQKGKAAPEWVFCNEEGTFLNEFLFRMRKFYPLIKAAKMRAFRIHDLRHTFASMHLQNGASVMWVKEQMGHQSIQITVDTYGHLIPGENRAAANRLGALVTSVRSNSENDSRATPADTRSA